MSLVIRIFVGGGEGGGGLSNFRSGGSEKERVSSFSSPEVGISATVSYYSGTSTKQTSNEVLGM